MPSQLNNTKQGAPEGRPPRINLLAWIVTSVVLGFVLLLTLRLAAQQHVTINGTCTQAGTSVPCTVAGFEQQDTVTVAIAPQNPTVPSAGAQQFTATVQFAQNASVLWSATAGAVDASGLFTAPSVSVDTPVAVTATSVADTTKFATTVATVKAAAAVTVAVSPKTVTLQTGATQQFTASVLGSTNALVNWTAQSGTVTAAGLFTAGSVAGNGSVTATSQADATKADSALISITSPPPPPPPPPTIGFDATAELPRVYVKTSVASTPSPGSTVTVSPAGLQTAINSANCGDTLLLSAGTNFAGNYTLPAKPCDDLHYITLRTSTSDLLLPPEGTRIQPCWAGVASLPGRPAFKNCPIGNPNLLAKITGGVQLANGANHYRLLGLEVARVPGAPGAVGVLVGIANGAGLTASHIVLDRVWLHGTPQEDTGTGFGVNGIAYGAIVDSYLGDFHCTSGTGACTDAHAIWGGTTSTVDGPYAFNRNFIEASGENILFGGGGGTQTPGDIEIRGNHFFKPLTWLAGQPGFVGGGTLNNPFIVKNLLELKNAQRVLVDGNIFEYNWGGFSQPAESLVFSPKNQAGANGTNICPTCLVQDVTVRNSTVSHVGAGIAIFNVGSDNGGVAKAGQRYSIHDVTIDDIDPSIYRGGNGAAFRINNGWATQDPNQILNGVSINHVTVFGKTVDMYAGNPTTNIPMYGFTLTNSVFGQVPYPIWNVGGGTVSCAYSSVPITVMNTCYPGGYKFAKNVFVNVNQGNFAFDKWPAGNFTYKLSGTVKVAIPVTDLQFANFNNGNGGDYTLLPASPYKNAGTDGKDLGADISAIKAATATAY